LIDTQTISSNEISPPMVLIGMQDLGRITQPELIAFNTAYLPEEVLMSVDAKSSASRCSIFFVSKFIYSKSHRRNVNNQITEWSAQ
jgi:hypothetical protein